MEPQTHLVHLLEAVVLFFVVNWIGRHAISAGYLQLSLYAKADEAPAFNFAFRLLSPLVFITLLAAFWHWVGVPEYARGIWWVVAYSFAVRWTFNVVVGRVRLMDWKTQFALASVTVSTGYWLSERVLHTQVNLLPNPSDLGNELWIIVLLFLYQTANGIRQPSAGSLARREAYIRNAYRRYRRTFGSTVERICPDAVATSFVYSVLIYEAFNRPLIYRWIERFVLFPAGRSKSTGIMQVQHKDPLTDAESVERGALKLVQAYESELALAEKEWRASCVARGLALPPDAVLPDHYRIDAMREAAHAYNVRSDYADEVLSIYYVISRDSTESAATKPSPASSDESTPSAGIGRVPIG